MEKKTGLFWRVDDTENGDTVLTGCAPYKKPADAFADMMKAASNCTKLPKYCNFIVFNKDTYREDFK